MRYINIGGWNRCWQVIQSHFPGYLDPISPLDLQLLHHEDESGYVLRLTTSVEYAGIVRGFMGSKTCCHDRAHDRYYLICDLDTWSLELDFEILHRRGPAGHLLERQNTELIAFP